MSVKKLILIFIFSTITICAQTVGKIYDKDEADSLYGESVTTLSMSKSQFEAILNETTDYVMFRIDNDRIIILGDDREQLYPGQLIVSEADVYNMYSKSKVVELLNTGSGSTVYVEQRSKPLTLTFGDYTLEESVWCPPYCD